MTLRLGVLDLGSHLHSAQIAPMLERLGYTRYWLSEHHEPDGFDGVNPVLMSVIAAGVTERMRVGPAGVLLNLHSPFRVAEDFRLLQLLFEGRIDLGVARAITTPELAAGIFDRELIPGWDSFDAFEARLRRLVGYLYDRVGEEYEPRRVVPQPVQPTQVEPALIWVLGTSGRGAELAATHGLAYSFSEFYSRNAGDGARAIEIYLRKFRPSPQLTKPTWNIHVGGICAPTADAAQRFRDSHGQMHNAIYGTPDTWYAVIQDVRTRYGMETSDEGGEIIVSSLHNFVPEAQLASYAAIAKVAGLRAS